MHLYTLLFMPGKDSGCNKSHHHLYAIFLYCCFLYFASAQRAETYREIKHCHCVCLLQSMSRTPLKTQHRCILFETLVSTLQFSYDHLLPDRTFGHDIACLPLSSCMKFIHMGVAHVHYSLVTWSRLIVSFVPQKISPSMH